MERQARPLVIASHRIASLPASRLSLSVLLLRCISALLWRALSPSSARIDASEKDLTTQQNKHREEIMKIQETAKQLQQAAVGKQTQAQQMVEAQ